VVEIPGRRAVRSLPRGLDREVTTAMRFGGAPGAPAMSGGGAPASAAPRENPFRYVVPEGWEELEPTSMRLVNLRPAGDPAAECSLTLLGGDGGGLAANVNRWRDQMGLPALEEEEVAQLPRTVLLGQPATLVDLRGAYRGMGDEAQPDFGLLGAVMVTEQFTLFLKMTGPADLVQAERANFERFYASLTAVFPGQDDPHAAGDPHAAPPQAQAGDHSREGLDFTLPDGWRELSPSGMRVVNLEVGRSQCYVIQLGGAGGGLEMNLNRWRGEVGLPPLDADGVAALERVPALGQEAPLLEVTGTYKGMGGPQGEDSRVLGVPVIRTGTSLFIKMVGPDQEVLAQRESFLTFVASLHEH
jgi:hypothetical protein